MNNWYSVKDKKKFGWNKGPKNKNSKKGYQIDKEYRKSQRKSLMAAKHKLFITGELNIIYQQIEKIEELPFPKSREEYISLNNKYGWNLIDFILKNYNFKKY